MLIAAIVGGALIPLITGKIADISGIHHAFIVPAICYLYIVLLRLRDSRCSGQRRRNA